MIHKRSKNLAKKGATINTKSKNKLIHLLINPIALHSNTIIIIV